jgi:hypothetical protein
MRTRQQFTSHAFGKTAAAIAVLTLAAVAPITPAQAFSKRVERACLPDYKNLCPQYRTNSPQLRACMESKANEISWSCKEALIDSGEVDRKHVRR